MLLAYNARLVEAYSVSQNREILPSGILNKISTRINFYFY